MRENKLIDMKELGDWLGMSPASIKSDLSRKPSTLPPGLKVGRKWRWREQDVERWLDQQAQASLEKFSSRNLIQIAETTRRRPGRPTKAEAIARRNGHG